MQEMDKKNGFFVFGKNDLCLFGYPKSYHVHNGISMNIFITIIVLNIMYLSIYDTNYLS